MSFVKYKLSVKMEQNEIAFFILLLIKKNS